jgi:hypothetical protein
LIQAIFKDAILLGGDLLGGLVIDRINDSSRPGFPAHGSQYFLKRVLEFVCTQATIVSQAVMLARIRNTAKLPAPSSNDM